MQFAISGRYQGGQIILNEQPPIDTPSQVMVVFLSESFSQTVHSAPKISKRQQQLGILADFKADPAFDEPLDKDELEQW